MFRDNTFKLAPFFGRQMTVVGISTGQPHVTPTTASRLGTPPQLFDMFRRANEPDSLPVAYTVMVDALRRADGINRAEAEAQVNEWIASGEWVLAPPR